MAKKLNTQKTVLNNVGNVVDPDGVALVAPEGRKYKITLEEYLEEDIEEENIDFFMDDITFIKSFRGNGIMLNEKLTYVEIATVVFLCDFICYTDCVLRKKGNKNGAPLTVRDLADLMGIKYETFRKTMSSLKKKQVIGYHSTGDEETKNEIKWITVNPYIFFRGIKVENWVKDFYADSEWAKMPRQKTRRGRNNEFEDDLEVES